MNINQLQDFYKKSIKIDNETLQIIQRKIRQVSMFRLSIVIIAAVLIYFFRHQGGWFIGITILLSSACMLALIKKHNRLFHARDYSNTSIRVYKEESEAIDYHFQAFDGAKEKISGSHAFSHDIDLFGEKSLFQYLNRTVTVYGKEVLTGWMENPLTGKEAIINRQEAVGELKQQPDMLHQFRVKGLLYPHQPNDIEDLRKFSEEKLFLLDKQKLWNLLAIFYPVFWITLIMLSVLGITPGAIIIVAIFACYALSESKTKKINRLQKLSGDNINVLSSYADLIRIIETHTVASGELQKLQLSLTGEKQKVSETIEKLSRLLNNLDQRSSGLGRFILNTLFLWDISYALKIEKWKSNHGEKLDQWMKILGEYDALCSLGTFAFNHDSYIFPVVKEEYFHLEATKVGHPLMHRDVCVKNDISMDKHPFFMIITGANMAGKSTYLRTIGVNYLLASIGAPVCAESFNFYPANLVTSLRTSDSLNDNESYFFAELKRLKMIIDRLQNGEKLFIILDEILKGTNSTDKQKGSLALMKQLIAMDGCGIIATHDLVLGKLVAEFPGNIKNYRFEAEIKDDHLSFSYKMQTGIAENMNACFLMNKMGITVGN